MVRRTIIVALCVSAVSAVSAARGDSEFEFELDGSLLGSPGIGSGTVLLNETTRRIQLSGTYEALIGIATKSHIHDARGGLLDLTISGGHTGTLDIEAILTIPQLNSLVAGTSFVNIHTDRFPIGEIRGTILPVPEPSSLLLIASIGAFALSRARARR